MHRRPYGTYRYGTARYFTTRNMQNAEREVDERLRDLLQEMIATVPTPGNNSAVDEEFPALLTSATAFRCACKDLSNLLEKQIDQARAKSSKHQANILEKPVDQAGVKVQTDRSDRSRLLTELLSELQSRHKPVRQTST